METEITGIVRALHKDFASDRRRKIGGREQKHIRVKETAETRGCIPPDKLVRVVTFV